MLSSPCPRRAPALGATCPSSYLLEQRTLKAYRARLHSITLEEMQELAIAVFGPPIGRFGNELTGAKAHKQFQDREARLDENIPDMLQSLRGEEHRRICLLLLDQHDVAAFARALFALDGGNALSRREPEAFLADEDLFQTATRLLGFGKLARRDTKAACLLNTKAACQPTGGPPLQLTPWPPVKPTLRTAKRRTRKPLLLRGQLALFPVAVLTGSGL